MNLEPSLEGSGGGGDSSEKKENSTTFELAGKPTNVKIDRSPQIRKGESLEVLTRKYCRNSVPVDFSFDDKLELSLRIKCDEDMLEKNLLEPSYTFLNLLDLFEPA